MAGPLNGLRVIELGGLVAGPFCGMLLADHGAEVVRIDRPVAPAAGPPATVSGRGRKTITLDLKNPDDVELLLHLVAKADVFFESFRPGVAERLGIGPDVCLRNNPALVYGRLTGWGQSGPLAHHAGHDINYIAQAGLLALMGRPGDPPMPPLNIAGDLAGGGLFLAFGILAAVHHAQKTGEGQVIDAAMIDGAALLMTTIREYAAAGASRSNGGIVSDGSHPLYTTYRCADGRFIAIGAMEIQFRLELARVLDIDPGLLVQGDDPSQAPSVRRSLEEVFARKSRDEWHALLRDNRQICFSPVLDPDEAVSTPHALERRSYVDLGSVKQPGPSPLFSRTQSAIPSPPPTNGQDDRRVVLREWLGQMEDGTGAS